ncbi:MAG TPA: tRNA 2-thiouridine(34) synthase MnmA [Thermoleophilaceae bacterium]|nr:tRNA 2-thiouridine(34) synthase MnmA [Thermoleophilaceae bacterium]
MRSAELIEQHLSQPYGRGALADAPHTGAAGGAACGDLVRISVRVEGDRVVGTGFEASGCAAVRAAGSAAAELVEGMPVLTAALVSPEVVAKELGGLAPSHMHAAELTCDALHRALGSAARDGDVEIAPSATKTRTLVAMSGGVDSAAAAQMALDAGDEVVAVTLELWSDPAGDGEQSCCSPQAVRGARGLAQRMGIPHFTLDLRDRFRGDVVDDFLAGYAGGATPNPCVRCNGLVRFDSMVELADRLGAARLTTGHYARIEQDDEGPVIRAAVDPRKDQSYVLARVTTDTLRRIGFPLGGYSKPDVRDLARRAGLSVADKPESQDLCFLAGTGQQAFVERHGSAEMQDAAGDIVDSEGHVLGHHDGHHRFTVGQRRGIRVAADQPLYVLAKDASQNRIVVGPREQLATTTVKLGPGRLHRPAAEIDAVRLRYQGAVLGCGVDADLPAGDHRGLTVELEREVATPAPGQVAALMRGEHVIGWALIAEPEAAL